MFTETWCDELSDMSVQNFEYFALNRTDIKRSSKRNSGGIVVDIRSVFVTEDTLVFKSSDDIICVKFNGQVLSLQNDLLLCLCYIVPENSSRLSLAESSTFDRLTEFILQSAVKDGESMNFILCGDMNSRTSVIPDYVIDDYSVHMKILPEEYCADSELPRFSQDVGRVNSNGHYLLDLCKQTGLRILNGRAGVDKCIGKNTFVGHQGSSLIDYVLCTQNLFSRVTKFEVSDTNILSDHCLITFHFDFDKRVENEITDELNYEKVNSKYVWKHELKSDFIKNVLDQDTTASLDELIINIDNCTCDWEVNGCIEELSGIIDRVASPLFKNHVGRAVACNDDKSYPWYNSDCYEKRSLFLHMLNNYRTNKNDVNRINMVRARSDYKNTVKNCKYEYDKNETEKLTKARFQNAKLYWKMLKQCAGVQKTDIELSSFEQYFKSVNNPESKFFTPDEDVLNFIDRYEQQEMDIMFNELNLLISDGEILKALKELKTNRSAGPDLLINEFFKHAKDILTPVLSKLFNKIFDLGYFPKSWSEGHVIPLHKKGSLNNVENYRGITLLSTIGKLFARVLNNRLADWGESYSVYIEAQAGFRSNMSTIDNIYVLHGLISHFLNSGKKLYCAFIDFTKAFDYIVRDNLWYKLIKLGIRGKVLNIIRSMYESVKTRVKYQNQLSDEYDCVLGVRQGECLSPFLFSIFLNDIEETFILKGANSLSVDTFKLFLMLYADDIVIFGNTPEELQNNLNILSEYCTRWRLVVNTVKTKVMIFKKGGANPRNLEFTYNGNAIDIVKKFSYLGVVFTTGGSFTDAQTTLSGQALKAIFKMNKYLYKFTYISVEHRLQLFDKLISPILNYGAEVWGFHKGDAVEKIHMKFCKSILGVRKTTQNDFVYGELGRKSLFCSRQSSIIRYWIKILESDETKYVKIIYNMLLNDVNNNPNIVNWASLLRDMLCNLGFRDVWLAQSVGNPKLFISIFKQRIHDNFIQTWDSRLRESSRALFYNSIKNFCFQPYLNICNLTKFRQSLTRLRVSAHRLEIEAGRWNKPIPTPVTSRTCTLCNVIENEFHFVLECPLYSELRDTYIKPYFFKRPNMFKFISLINSSSETILRNLALFIYKAFQLRNSNTLAPLK